MSTDYYLLVLQTERTYNNAYVRSNNYVQAKSEEEARDTYLIQGMTSALYEKEIDRSIIDVSELVNKNGEPYD